MAILRQSTCSKEIIDFASAFSHYSGEVFNNSEKADWQKLAAAATGVIGIASDIMEFHAGGPIGVLILFSDWIKPTIALFPGDYIPG